MLCWVTSKVITVRLGQTSDHLMCCLVHTHHSSSNMVHYLGLKDWLYRCGSHFFLYICSLFPSVTSADIPVCYWHSQPRPFLYWHSRQDFPAKNRGWQNWRSIHCKSCQAYWQFDKYQQFLCVWFYVFTDYIWWNGVNIWKSYVTERKQS